MRKVIVIGCPGSGKSTFSRVLQSKTGIPLYHLDMLYWNADKTTVEKSLFIERLRDVMKKEEWIIDGNYSRTIEVRIQNSDTIFLFDLPTEVCLQGATERLGKARYDVPWIDMTLNPELKQQIEEFPEKVLPRIYELLEKHRDGKAVIVFKSREDADVYINEIRNS